MLEISEAFLSYTEWENTGKQPALTPPAGFALNYTFTLDYTYPVDSFSPIDSGMNNTIVIPASIFTNSYFYQHEIAAENGATNWPGLTFYSEDSSSGSMVKDVAGMLYGNLSGDDFQALLEEISKNLTGVVTYNYTFDNPTQMNIPIDALGLVPFSGYANNAINSVPVQIKNSATGTVSTSSFGNTLMFDFGSIIGGFVNFVISVGTVVWDFAKSAANIVCKAIAAVIATAAEFIQQLADALKNFGMAMLGAFKEAMDAVADAVEKVVEVLNAIWNWIVEKVTEIVSKALEPIVSGIQNLVRNFISAVSEEFSEFIGSSKSYNLMEATGEPYNPVDAAVTIWSLLIPMVLAFAFLLTAVQTVESVVNAFLEGTETLVLGLFTNTIKSLILSALISITVTGTCAEVEKVASNGKVDESITDTFINFGAGASLVAAAYSFILTFMEVTLNAGKFGVTGLQGILAFGFKKVGTALALLSFVIASLAPMEIEGSGLLIVDIIASMLALAGVASLYLSSQNPIETTLLALSPLTNMLMDGLTMTGAIGTWVTVISHYNAGYYSE